MRTEHAIHRRTDHDQAPSPRQAIFARRRRQWHRPLRRDHDPRHQRRRQGTDDGHSGADRRAARRGRLVASRSCISANIWLRDIAHFACDERDLGRLDRPGTAGPCDGRARLADPALLVEIQDALRRPRRTISARSARIREPASVAALIRDDRAINSAPRRQADNWAASSNICHSLSSLPLEHAIPA